MEVSLAESSSEELEVKTGPKLKSFEPIGASFLSSTDIIAEGDTVIIYVNFGKIYAIKVKRGCTLNMKYGTLRHEVLIGQRFGSRISASAGYVYALNPSADLWTRSLSRRTQILYTPDCALIVMLLDAKPGSIICESGTGSGSLSHTLAMTIAPSGHLYTHDIEESRVRDIEAEFKDHGLCDFTTAVTRNVLVDGFIVEDACDGVFLDLPAPWDAIDHAKRALSKSRGGRVVSFSPCIEQVQRVCEVLRSRGFVKVETVELVPRKLKALGLQKTTLAELNASVLPTTNENESSIDGSNIPKPAKKRKLNDGVDGNEDVLCYDGMIPFPPDQPSHTGYLTSATLLPSAA